MEEVFKILFHPFFFLPVLFILTGILIFFISRREKENILKRSLDYALYEVSFPRMEKEEGKTFKDVISVMEQFYTSMVGLNTYFSFEIVSPATESETNFYVSVPREAFSFFEKQVHSFFPEAEIREEAADYNIFKYKSPVVGAVATLQSPDVLPIQSYENMTADPFEVVVNAFGELHRENEGAALQVIIEPRESNYSKTVSSAVNLINKGEPVKTALIGGEPLSHSFLRTLSGGLLYPRSEAPQGTAVSPLLKEEQQEVIKLLNQKSSKQIMRANIRLAVSAQTQDGAQKILDQLKGYFAQFALPRGNQFVVRQLKGGALKKMLHNFSFRIFSPQWLNYLNTAELTGLIHFPIYTLLAPKVKFLKIKSAEPPANLSQEGVLIGNSSFRGRLMPIRLSKEDRRRHFYTIGQTGTGKSALLKNMVMEDIKAGEGVCFIDPHGSDVEDIIGQIPQERWEDVVYFNPADIRRPLGLNMLEYNPANPEQKTFIVNELLEIFDKLYDMSSAGGPMFEQYFRNAALLVMEDPESGNTLLEISRVFTDSEFRNYKLSKTTNPVVRTFWTETAEKAGGEAALQNMVPYITSKFDTFLANDIMRPIVVQEKSSFNFRDIMDDKKILLVNLSKGKLGDLNANLLGMIIVGKIFMAAMSRVDTREEERKDFYLYMDEFQNISTNTIAMILSEARKYKLNLTIAHQFIGQLSEDISKAVFGNVGSMAVFRIGREDADFLAKQFEPVFNADDLTNMPNYNLFLKLLVNGETSRPFVAQTVAPEKSDEITAQKVKEVSAIKYGRPLSEVESEISKRYVAGIQVDKNE